MKTITESSKNVMLASLVFNFLLKSSWINIMVVSMKGNSDHLVSVVNALQLIFHLPIMNIILQANAMTYLEIVIPIVMFDFIDSIPFFSDRFDGFYYKGSAIDIPQ